jgi:hypothetical protein
MTRLFSPRIRQSGRTNTKKCLIPAFLIVRTLIALLSTGGAVLGQPVAPSNPFATLLEGIYAPIAHVPPLGFSIDINNEAVLKIAIFNIDSGVPSSTDQVAGTFYVQYPVGDLCAYVFPKGKILARFTFVDDVTTSFTFYPDPVSGPSWIFEGTEELEILEATGIYKSFTGGHIHMVDRLEYRASDDKLIEHCFCHYSRAHGKP